VLAEPVLAVGEHLVELVTAQPERAVGEPVPQFGVALVEAGPQVGEPADQLGHHEVHEPADDGEPAEQHGQGRERARETPPHEQRHPWREQCGQ
jgi:hypothetical protein